MGVVEAAEDGDFGDKVVLELFVELVHVDRLDGDGLALFLYTTVWLATDAYV